MPQRSFDDFAVGRVFELPPTPVTREEIIAFAREFDPQPFHLDETSPAAALTGGLIASGWHVCALFMRMLYDGLIAGSTCLGSPGIESLKWQRPVRPGDTLSGRTTVTGARASSTRPERGIVVFRHEVFNQNGESVMTMENPVFFGRGRAP
jgi:acyl dehydratase